MPGEKILTLLYLSSHPLLYRRENMLDTLELTNRGTRYFVSYTSEGGKVFLKSLLKLSFAIALNEICVIVKYEDDSMIKI